MKRKPATPTPGTPGSTPGNTPGTPGNSGKPGASANEGGSAGASGASPDQTKGSDAPTEGANTNPDPIGADGRRCLVLERDGKKLVIRYKPGEEARVIAGLSEMAGRNDSDLTWFDAALLSHQMGQRLKAKLDRFKPAA